MIGFLKLTWQKIEKMKLDNVYLFKCWVLLSKWRRIIKFTYWDSSKRNLWWEQIKFGENKTFNRLIAINDVSGLADKSNNFGNFLKVIRKFG